MEHDGGVGGREGGRGVVGGWLGSDMARGVVGADFELYLWVGGLEEEWSAEESGVRGAERVGVGGNIGCAKVDRVILCGKEIVVDGKALVVKEGREIDCHTRCSRPLEHCLLRNAVTKRQELAFQQPKNLS